MNASVFAQSVSGACQRPSATSAVKAERREQDRDRAEDRRRLSPTELERLDAVDEHRHARCRGTGASPSAATVRPASGASTDVSGKKRAGTHTMAQPASASIHPRAVQAKRSRWRRTAAPRRPPPAPTSPTPHRTVRSRSGGSVKGRGRGGTRSRARPGRRSRARKPAATGTGARARRPTRDDRHPERAKRSPRRIRRTVPRAPAWRPRRRTVRARPGTTHRAAPRAPRAAATPSPCERRCRSPMRTTAQHQERQRARRRRAGPGDPRRSRCAPPG